MSSSLRVSPCLVGQTSEIATFLWNFSPAPSLCIITNTYSVFLTVLFSACFFRITPLIQSMKTKAEEEEEEMISWKEWGTTQKISNRNSNHSLVSPICASYYVRTIYIMYIDRQGCISCGILVSGIGARGVSSEHMENMEMFSCSPT